MKTVSMQDLLEIYRQKNHCRDIVEARTKLEKVGRDMYEHPDTEVSSKGEYLLLRLQEWDEQQAKQQANTPPPKQKPYATPQTNGASQAPPQTNTAQAYPDGYNTTSALLELLVLSAKGGALFATLYFIGAACVNAAKGIGAGIAIVFETVTPYLVYFGAGSIALIALYEGFRKKETPTTQTGGTGYIVNNYYYGDGTTAERK